MKYTYFSTIKSGKHLMRSLFWLNNRSTCIMTQSNPLWAALSKPIGKLYKLEWYWCDEYNQLRTHNHFLDVSDKLFSSHYSEYWYPTKDHRGYYYLPYDQWNTHENFWRCLDSILERDIITNPFSLFGYVGKDIHKMLEQVKNDDPPMKPHANIVQQLKKRKSIVAYKEDIEHLAYNILSLAGTFGTIENAINTINQVREFQNYMPIFLDKYEIPYEKFSLDSGDYSKTFELEKVLPRNSTQTLWGTNDLGIDVKKEVSNYMTNYP